MDKAEEAATTRAPPPAAKKPRAPLSWKARLGLIAFGTALGLVLLEVLLRSLGFVYYFERRWTPGDHPEDAFVILCVGDSCTFGSGASSRRSFSYPAQLQQMLDERNPDRKYRVVNMGYPGANSSQMARRFEGFIRLHHPDLAIILIGNNDVWNQNESRMHLIARGEKSKFTRRLRARLRMWSDELRVVRLARCIALSVDDDREGRWNAQEDTSPSDGRFRRGMKILGDIELVEKLYRINFRQMSKVAKKYDMDLLWLDYHLPARFGETDYIDPVLKDLGAPYVDLGPYFRAGDKPNMKLICGDKWHANDLGYTVFARAIYNKLAEMGHASGPSVEVMAGIPTL